MVYELQPGDRWTDSGVLVIGFRFTVQNPKNRLMTYLLIIFYKVHIANN